MCLPHGPTGSHLSVGTKSSNGCTVLRTAALLRIVLSRLLLRLCPVVTRTDTWGPSQLAPSRASVHHKGPEGTQGAKSAGTTVLTKFALAFSVALLAAPIVAHWYVLTLAAMQAAGTATMAASSKSSASPSSPEQKDANGGPLSIVFSASWVKLQAPIGEGAFSRVHEGGHSWHAGAGPSAQRRACQ